MLGLERGGDLPGLRLQIERTDLGIGLLGSRWRVGRRRLLGRRWWGWGLPLDAEPPLEQRRDRGVANRSLQEAELARIEARAFGFGVRACPPHRPWIERPLLVLYVHAPASFVMAPASL